MGYIVGRICTPMGSLYYDTLDDNGLVLPPTLAPIQVVIVPIYRSQVNWRYFGKAGAYHYGA